MSAVPSLEAAELRPPDPERARELVARYDQPGPRYTSYPTAPVWSEDFGPDAFRAALERAGSRSDALSVYVHIPFCEQLCTYCACNRTISRDHGVTAPYLESLAHEAEAVARALGRERPHEQLAVGGAPRPTCRRANSSGCATSSTSTSPLRSPRNAASKWIPA